MKLGDRTYKNHLDGYNQMDLLTGKGPSKRARALLLRRATAGCGPHRRLQVPVLPAALGLAGREGHDRHAHRWSTSARIRSSARRPFGAKSEQRWAAATCNDFYAREFWRFVLVQQYVAKLAQTAIEYPPMQDPASFNLEAVKKKIEELIKNRPGQ